MVPGLGHLYAGRARRGVTWYAVALAAAAVAVAAILLMPLGVATLFVLVGVSVGLRLWIATDAARMARAAPTPYRLRRFNRWYVYVAIVILTAGVQEGAKRFVEAFRLPSGSMEPTLQLGEWFFATKSRQLSPARGEVVIVASPDPDGLGTLIVTRVVALAGDTIEMRRGTLFKGARVDEPYAQHGNPEADIEDSKFAAWQARYVSGRTSYRPTLKNWGPLVVPPDSVFVLGDNRDHSSDSRYFGFVGTDRMRGRPRVIYYSYDREGDTALPFLTAIRWDRIGVRPQ